jgi:hypothetical protein
LFETGFPYAAHGDLLLLTLLPPRITGMYHHT